MKASRAAIRQSKALARIEEKLDRVLTLLGEAPSPPTRGPEPDKAETDIEDLSRETVVEEPAIHEVSAPEEPVEAKPKGKPKG